MRHPATSASDAADRLRYLSQLGALLWPAPAGLDGADADRPAGWSAGEEYLLLPGRRRPRLLVPAGDRRAAASAVRHYAIQPSPAARARAAALALAVRSGVLAATARRVRVAVPPGAGTITTHLSDVLGRPVLVSMHLGAARANRKPVLQVLDPAGRTVAYVKVGIDPLTRRLVREEGRTLSAIGQAGLTRIRPPRVLHQGDWRGLELLVLSALPIWRARRVDPGRLAPAMIELAGAAPVDEAAVAGSDYWRRLGERMLAVLDEPRSDPLRRTAEAVGRQLGGEVLRYGAWHGDWTAWNCAWRSGTVLLWDWERYARPAPLGFDALHYWMHDAVQHRHTPLPAAAEGCLAHAADVLEPFGLTPGQAAATARLYLLDLAVRYVADRQDAAGGRGGAVEQWLLPALTDGRVPTRARTGGSR